MACSVTLIPVCFLAVGSAVLLVIFGAAVGVGFENGEEYSTVDVAIDVIVTTDVRSDSCAAPENVKVFVLIFVDLTTDVTVTKGTVMVMSTFTLGMAVGEHAASRFGAV